MQLFGQQPSKQAVKTYIEELVKLCQERHSNHSPIKDYYPLLLSASVMVSKYSQNFFPDVALPEIAMLVQSANQVFSKLVKITLYLTAPGSKNFTTIPRAATKGFLELVGDFCSKYSAWATPDKAILVDNIKRAILGLQDVYGYPVNNQATLTGVSTQIIRLRTRLPVLVPPGDLEAFNITLVGAIKATITRLHVSLGSPDPDSDIFDPASIGAAMERQRIWLLRMTNRAVVDELYAHLNTTYPVNAANITNITNIANF